MPSKVKIAIGIVDNRDSFRKPFVTSLLGILAVANQWGVAMREKGKEYEVDIIPGEQGAVDIMRCAVANAAVKNGYDFILWLDSDMTFPADLIPRMIAYFENPECEAVTGLYTLKAPPYTPHAYRTRNPETGGYITVASFPLDRPFFVEGAGFGCIMMRVSVFNRVEKPYFQFKYDDTQMVQGEDLDFCTRAKMKMVLDPSIICGHLQERVFGLRDYLEYNKLEIKDDADGKRVVVTDEQKAAIMAASPHMKNMGAG